MLDYQEIKIEISPFTTDAADLLAAYLADIGYDSFLQVSDHILAYIPYNKYNPQELKELLEDFPMQVKLSFSAERIEGKDWNEEWEKNYFKPIVIADECVIHSTFHKEIPKAQFDIVIDPKMAFGTGHHSTTSLIMSSLLKMDLKDKMVIDMGTGTGILAILCMMKGCRKAVGIEIDKDAYDNACDNCNLNGVDVDLINGDATSLAFLTESEKADLLIANINRNIILTDMEQYAEALKPDGEMLLSGFYESDVPLITRRAEMLGMEISDFKSDNSWTVVKLKHRK